VRTVTLADKTRRLGNEVRKKKGKLFHFAQKKGTQATGLGMGGKGKKKESPLCKVKKGGKTDHLTRERRQKSQREVKGEGKKREALPPEKQKYARLAPHH